ncbi:MAG: hypothetical protein RL660_2345 [Bacteroidota bacterium]|jgi:hypothetical protein
MDNIKGRIFKLEFATNTLCYFAMLICRTGAGAFAQANDDIPVRLLYGKLSTIDNHIEYDDTQSTNSEEIIQPSLYLSNLCQQVQQQLETKLIAYVQHIKNATAQMPQAIVA